MLRCSRAVPVLWFRRRPSRLTESPNLPPSSKPSSGIRPRRSGPVALAAVSAAALSACADSVWEPSGPVDAPAPAIAQVLSESAAADAPSLPPRLDAIRSMESEGCVIHLRHADGSYASKIYRLRYGREARKADGRWRALVYNVRGIVTRPAEGGGTEALPERLGARAACLLPDTGRGLEEARGMVEAILAARGLAGFGRTSADAGMRGSGWAAAWAAIGPLAERLAPRPLAAAQQRCYVYPPSMFGVGCPESPPVSNVNPSPITVTCPAGFDFEYSSGNCVRTGFDPVPPISPGNAPGSGGGGTSPPPPPPPEPEDCGDARDGLAAEYARAGMSGWPCKFFSKSNPELIKQDGDTENGAHEGYGYVDTDLLDGLAEFKAAFPQVTDQTLEFTSGYRCPAGNAHNPSGNDSFHVHGRAADFWVRGAWTPKFKEDVETWGDLNGARESFNYSPAAGNHNHLAW